ncbi:hypothetical protein CRUP_009227 [Coryphaenoides rupestris]|nr:hypothetical protein CRUP_009227 [Coryphaenoides rupestris]
MDNGRTRLQKAHEDVTEVKDIMMVNLQKADERSGKLEDLESRADDMLVTSRAFERTAQKVKHKKWWDNMRMKVVLVGVAVVAVSVIVGIIIYLSVSSANGE